jgi:YbbR domain-containing protein
MVLSILRWLGRNLGTLLMAFILALIVWISAVISADPNQEDVLDRPVAVEKIGLSPELLIMNNVPGQVRLTLDAPVSIWKELRADDNLVRSWLDLSGLGPGEYSLPVNVQITPRTARIVTQDPKNVDVILERLVTQTYSVTLEVKNRPALGYEAGATVFTPTQVTLSGAESLVFQVKEIHAILDIAGASQSISTSVPLRPLDANGRAVTGVSINPETLVVNKPVTLLRDYRNVIVRVDTAGQVANGYKLTNIVVTPSNVVVTSSDPNLLTQLPGYVETQPLSLDGAQDDLEAPLELNLPAGISVVNDQKVLVQVFISPIESNLTVTLPVDVIGLTPGLMAQVAPTTVDLILSGPLPVLDLLKASDIRVIVNVTGLEQGTYQLNPTVAVLPERVRIESILPSSLEVIIVVAPTPTETVTPIASPTPTQTPRP